jgi:hypothetical protein
MNLLMPTKRQFKMQLEDDMIGRLKSAAARLGRDTAQEVAEEILSVYFPVWLAVGESARRAIDYQVRSMSERRTQKANAKSRKPKDTVSVEKLPDKIKA